MADPTRCLLFGGSGALGRVVCETLASQGARVAFTYHTRSEIAKGLTERLPDTVALTLDLASLSDVERVVDEAASALGGLDAFVQCAGVAVTTGCSQGGSHPTISHVDERAWDDMMDVNVKSTFFALRRVVEVLRSSGGGNIVLVGSVDGVKPVPAPVHYAASKGALTGMIAALAKELGEHNVRVNMVAPGILEGGISGALEDRLMKEYLKHCGLKRLGRLSEVANVVAWLVRHNTYVTGQTVLVDGAL
jgi:3-oxoacyl-[acyl-carrier protein] reductase